MRTKTLKRIFNFVKISTLLIYFFGMIIMLILFLIVTPFVPYKSINEFVIFQRNFMINMVVIGSGLMLLIYGSNGINQKFKLKYNLALLGSLAILIYYVIFEVL